MIINWLKTESCCKIQWLLVEFVLLRWAKVELEGAACRVASLPAVVRTSGAVLTVSATLARASCCPHFSCRMLLPLQDTQQYLRLFHIACCVQCELIYKLYQHQQWNAGNFLTSCKPVSCSGRTLHHGVSKLHLMSLVTGILSWCEARRTLFHRDY